MVFLVIITMTSKFEVPNVKQGNIFSISINIHFNFSLNKTKYRTWQPQYVRKNECRKQINSSYRTIVVSQNILKIQLPCKVILDSNKEVSFQEFISTWDS